MFRLAFRRLRRARSYTTVVVLTIALCTGANATVYSMLRGLLTRTPAGIADPESLVQVGRGERADKLDVVSFPLFNALRRVATPLGTLAAVSTAKALIGEATNVQSRGV